MKQDNIAENLLLFDNDFLEGSGIKFMINPAQKPEILHVDDDTDFLDIFAITYKNWFNTISCNNGEEALKLLKEKKIDAILIDYDMPGIDGLELLSKIKTDMPDMPVFLFTGQGNEEVAREAFLLGVSDYFTKDLTGIAHREKLVKSINNEIEFHKTAREKRESEEKYRNYIDNAPDGVFVADGTGKYLEVNNAAARITGYSKEELLNLSIPDLIHPHYRDKAASHFRSVVEEGKATGDLKLIKKDGSYYWMTVDAVKISQDRYIAFCKDISAQKETEEALRTSSNLLKSLMENTIDFIVIGDREGNPILWNAATAKSMMDNLGVEMEPGVRSHKHIRDKEVTLQWEKWIEQVLSGDKFMSEFSYEYTPGKFQHLETSFQPIKEEDEITGFSMVTRDITSRKEVERALQLSEQKYRTILDVAEVIINYFDINANYLLTNKKAADYFFLKPEDFIGKPVGEFYGEEWEKIIKERIKRAIETDEPVIYEDMAELPSGTHWFLTTYNRVLNPEGNIDGIQLVSTEITQQKKLEEKLLKKNRELLNFAYKVTHDLKNPINMIKGFLNIINEDPSTFKQCYERIDRQTDRIIKFIDDMLLLAKAGKSLDTRKETNLNELIEKTLKSVQPEDLSIILDIKKLLPIIQGELISLKQLFTILFQNSIYHRKPKQDKLIITIDFERKEDKTIISFNDNGSGIEENNLENIFNFGFSTRGNERTGMGLAIAKRITESYGGKIWAESPGKNEGTTIFIEIPDSIGSESNI